MEIKCNCGHKFNGFTLFDVQKNRNSIPHDIDVISSKRIEDKWIFKCPKCKEKNKVKTS